MKILIFCHRLEIGGTLNCIEIASTLRDRHGHEVVFFATPGPFLQHVEERGLRFIAAPPARFHPSIARVRALREVVRRERPDLLHVWEYYQCLEAYFIEHLLKRVPMSVTSMMMEVVRLLPKSLPTTFGTPQMVDQARRAGRRRVALLMPPVDVELNAPGAVDAEPFRAAHGLKPDDITIVTVSRLSYRDDLKYESLHRTISAVRALGRELPVRFVIVGDGQVRDELRDLAEKTNAELGRPAVALAGALTDPRPAYAAADIVVGMGGSALRGMAFGKPVIVVGRRGFAAPLTPETAASFLYQGMYGVGDGDHDNSNLLESIRGLAAAKHEQRSALGDYARSFVLRHFALDVVTAGFSEFCDFAVASQPRRYRSAVDGLRTAYIWARERRWYC